MEDRQTHGQMTTCTNSSTIT